MEELVVEVRGSNGAFYKQNARFQQMENEYNKKLAESAQVIAGLQNTIDSLKEEGQRQETFFKEAMQKFEEEKNQLIRENECANRTAADLKTVNSAIREEMSEEMDAAEKRYQDAVKKFEEEKRQLTKDHEQAIKVLAEVILEEDKDNKNCNRKQHDGHVRKG